MEEKYFSLNKSVFFKNKAFFLKKDVCFDDLNFIMDYNHKYSLNYNEMDFFVFFEKVKNSDEFNKILEKIILIKKNDPVFLENLFNNVLKNYIKKYGISANLLGCFIDRKIKTEKMVKYFDFILFKDSNISERLALLNRLLFFKKIEKIKDFKKFIKHIQLEDNSRKFTLSSIIGHVIVFNGNGKDIIEILETIKFSTEKDKQNLYYILTKTRNININQNSLMKLYNKYYKSDSFNYLKEVQNKDLIKKEILMFLSLISKDIFLYTIKQRMKFNNKEINKKILLTDDIDIIKSVYCNINRFSWTQEELLNFVSKNNLDFNNNLCNILIK